MRKNRLKMGLIGIVITLGLAAFTPAHAAPRECDPAKSKPCGRSCISLEFNCKKGHDMPGAAIVKPAVRTESIKK